jgi:RNA polymerase sigma-70 factor (ECF subfamily)
LNKVRQFPSNLVGAAPATGGADDSVPAPDSDSDLVERSRAGDLEAFDVLVTRYRGKVYAMVYNMVRNEADAWDLAQDVFVKAWKALPGFQARSGFFTWLYRITYNVTCDWLRRRRVESAGEFDDRLGGEAVAAGAATVPHRPDRPDERMQMGELAGRIGAALAELSDDHRAAVLMREVQGMKYEEIAEAMGCSVGTVMSRLFYARKKLQGLLADLDPRGPSN